MKHRPKLPKKSFEHARFYLEDLRSLLKFIEGHGRKYVLKIGDWEIEKLEELDGEVSPQIKSAKEFDVAIVETSETGFEGRILYISFAWWGGQYYATQYSPETLELSAQLDEFLTGLVSRCQATRDEAEEAVFIATSRPPPPEQPPAFLARRREDIEKEFVKNVMSWVFAGVALIVGIFIGKAGCRADAPTTRATTVETSPM